jgi:putative copper export protein
MAVYAADGSVVSDDDGGVDPDDAHVLTADVRGTVSGTYTVRWQVISADDGHFSKGSFPFSFGKEAVSPGAWQGQVQTEHRTDWIEEVTIWLELLGSAILLGVVAVTSLVWRNIHNTVSEESLKRFRASVMRLVWLAWGLIAIGALSYLALKSRNLSLDQGTPLMQAFRTFLFTVAGRYTVYRLVFGAVAATLLLKPGKARAWLALVFIIVLDLLRARVSHAAASSFLPTVSIVINAFHLFFKDLWIGGLVVLVCALIPVLDREKNDALAARALLYFSRLTLAALALGGASGVYVVWLHLKSVGNVFTTHWGGYFLALGAYAVILLGLRLYQYLVLHPAFIGVLHGNASPAERENIRPWGLVLVTEMWVGGAVLLFSSMLVITPPPLSFQRFYEQGATDDGGTVTFGEHHFEDDQFLITVSRGDKKAARTGAALTVTATNADKNSRPLTVSLTQRFAGGYVFPKTVFAPPGKWNVQVTERENGLSDITHAFMLRYPDDVLAAHVPDDQRPFDSFTIVLIAVAVLLVAFAVMQERRHEQLLARIPSYTHEALPRLRVDKLVFVLPFTLLLLVAIGTTLGGHNHGSSAFPGACTAVGGRWHGSAPMRAGRVTSNTEVLGCTVETGKGIFHFADPREFVYDMQ